MTHTSGCLICGEDLQYTDQETNKTCNFCGKTFLSNASCINDHFICDTCHASEALEVIFRTTLENKGTDPIALATRIMQHPSLVMHGPEHHFLVPAVLLSCYYNHLQQLGVTPDNIAPLFPLAASGKKAKTTSNNEEPLTISALKRKKLELARKRSSHVLGGFCGSHGTCGAAIGSGIFLSLILDSTPLKEKEWKMSNMLTSKALHNIAMAGGPRCCKRDTYMAIQEACLFVATELNVTLPVSEPQCTFSNRNKECLQTNCLYYG
jgi:hypothetical protein